MYDLKLKRSVEFNLPIICVGNLALGGTGKTPMTEYLIELLKKRYKVATLSRGYKRKTKGYVLADNTTTALELGDEPMQFHMKFPDIAVAVGEERIVAVPQLLYDNPGTEVIILDDAFQHRQIKPMLNIILTEYAKPYSEDKLVPFGTLRDVQSSSSRADIIVVTKCPERMVPEEKERLTRSLKLQTGQELFFTTLSYKAPYHIFDHQPFTFLKDTEVLAVTGIANPQPMIRFLKEHLQVVEHMDFKDHHIYRSADFKEIRAKFNELKGSSKIILTTEKDAVRLHKFRDELKDFPIFCLPIAHKFLFGEGEKFDQMVAKAVENFQKK